MGLREAILAFKNLPRFMHNVTAWYTLPPRPAQVAPFPEALDPWLAGRLRARGVHALYVHQAAALEGAWHGQHVVVVTPTASGKTLCYNLPILHALHTAPTASALYLFPTKALAQDQLAELRRLIGEESPTVRAEIYDGDTPRATRREVRASVQLLITNPDMLHSGILPHHTLWHRFLSSLRFVVIDEMHTYRGIFGSHLANVIRRFKRVCRFYGASPQFILSSATIANPAELAERLIEERVMLIDENGAPAGEKHFVLYNPPVVDRILGVRRSMALEARDLATHFLAHGVQTIVFARSRSGTELLLTYLRDKAAEIGLPLEAIRGYRGGYLPSARREIEGGLRAGKVRAVVATNALELGIDIGHLGACVMAGYPGTIASAWQQAGRAGRTAESAIAVLVASPSPLDQYMVTHPQYFFSRSPEHGLINPNNLNILTSHVQCAAFELPFAEGERFGCFEQTNSILGFLEEEQVLHRSGGTWHWMSDSYPAQGVSLRTSDPNGVVIQNLDGDGPQVIGQIDAASAPTLIHEGAIYIHEGQQYEVIRLDWEGRKAEVRPVQVDYYTEASQSVDIRVLDCFEQKETRGLLKAHGEVLVSSLATSYKKIKLYTNEVLGSGEILLPQQDMHTTACWFSMGEELVERLRREGIWRITVAFDRGPNWQVQRELARQRDGGRCRHCGAPEREGHQHDVHHVRPFAMFGYVPGQNANYLQANDLSNLITLCPRCHRLAESAQALRSVLAALAELIRHVAPVFLMCDAHDLGVVSDSRNAFAGLPTIYVYDRVPAGIGLSEHLYALQDEILASALELVRACRCERGCPSCVGPVTESDEDIKVRTIRLLEMLTAVQ